MDNSPFRQYYIHFSYFSHFHFSFVLIFSKYVDLHRCFRGQVVMPLRIAKPWLLLDWIYKLTETASAEMDQKHKLDEFTKKVTIEADSKISKGSYIFIIIC